MESAIITLLVSAVGALVIAIMIIVTIYKDKLHKAQKRCEEMQSRYDVLSTNYETLYECCDELLKKREK